MNKKQCLLILSKKQYAEFVIKGQSFRYNQLCDNGNFANTNYWGGNNGSVSATDNELTYTCTTVGTYAYDNVCYQIFANYNNKQLLENHKYIFIGQIKSSVSASAMIYLTGPIGSGYEVHNRNTTLQPDEWTTMYIIKVFGSATYSECQLGLDMRTMQVGDTYKVRNCMLIDLTALGLDTVATINDFYNTYIGKAIQSGFYIPYSQNCAIYNASSPFDFVYKTFAPTTDFELRGINNAQDIYHNTTGEITRKIGVVDLGTLTWNYNSNNGSFNNGFSDYPDVKAVSYGQTPNIICSKYLTAITKYGNDDLTSLPNKSITLWTTLKTIIIKDTSYTDANNLKASLNGVLLYYELDDTTTDQVENVALNVGTNKCYDNNGLELEIV